MGRINFSDPVGRDISWGEGEAFGDTCWGLFAKHGLDLQLKYLAATTAVQAMVGGSEDIGKEKWSL
ncbi:MAG TPA: hypothetical protein VJM80_07205 [bacterium]|nr:hypothetical protein [bacterium]